MFTSERKGGYIGETEEMSVYTGNSPTPQGALGTPLSVSIAVDDDRVSGNQQDSADDNNNMFSNIIPTPIRVTRNQSNGVMSAGGSSKSLQYSLANLSVFQNLPRETSRGVDDLTRMKMAISSGIPEEVKWALKKYLAYSNKAPYMINLKDLPELLPLFKRFIENLKPLVENFDGPILGDVQCLDILQTGLNSILILRNLAQDTESVQVLVSDKSIKDFILIVLQKFECIARTDSDWQIFEANASFFNELVHYALDLMEAISSYIAPAKKDDLYFQTLLSLLNYTKDRYMVLSILRSLSRLLVRSKADEESAADNLDQRTLSLIVSFLIVECDNELMTAALDFLYQYILPGNQRISLLLNDTHRFATLAAILPRLLTYNINQPDYSILEKSQISLVKRLRPPAPTVAPDLDKELFNELLQMNEPMRSTTWLRCCFEPVTDAEFTQINLWRAYESRFAQPVRESGRKLLPAVEFIKNVSNAFSEASAMVITESSTGKKRFVMKGIQPRPKPLGIQEGEMASKHPLPPLQSKFLDDAAKIAPARQRQLPEIRFPTSLSEVSKAATTFLCLLSNESEGPGSHFCKTIKPVVLHKLADVPPLSCALSEYMDNTPGL